MAGKPSTALPLLVDNPTVKLVDEKAEMISTFVHFTDGTTEKEAFYLKLHKSSLDQTLSDLRANVAGLTSSIEISHFPFCGKRGANVSDKLSIREYLTDCLQTDPAEAPILNVYMKDEAIAKSKISPESQVGEAAVKASAASFKYAPELEEQDWAVVSESNALCYGIRVIFEKKKADASAEKPTQKQDKKEDDRGVPLALERARYPAFRLRKRTIYSDALPNSKIRGVKLDLRLPDFIIDDRSYVTTYETETEIQASMASSSFSETDVSAAGGGSFFGMSLEASAGYNESSKEKRGSESTKKNKRVTVAYNFPRVTVFLDERSLELTPECDSALRKVKDGAGLRLFQEDYGEFFGSRVQLGGRLFATEDVDLSTAGSSREVAAAMKASASASFSGWGASASVSASRYQDSTASQAGSSRSSSINLTWQANGGDTLLCNSPTAWAPTVAHHWNWRITKQDKITSLIDSIARLRGMEGLAAEAEKWGVKTSLDIFRKPPPPPKKTTFTLHADDPPNASYLLAFPASTCDISKVVTLLGSLDGTPIPIDSNIQSRGCVILRPETVERRPDLYPFLGETESGEIATEIKYGTKYRVKNNNTGLYVDYTTIGKRHFAFANPNRGSTDFIMFKDADGNARPGTEPVSDGSTVTLHFYGASGSENGYLVVGVADSRSIYLCVWRNSDYPSFHPQALKLVMKYC